MIARCRVRLAAWRLLTGTCVLNPLAATSAELAAAFTTRAMAEPAPMGRSIANLFHAKKIE
jgi:hypothetical protein